MRMLQAEVAGDKLAEAATHEPETALAVAQQRDHVRELFVERARGEGRIERSREGVLAPAEHYVVLGGTLRSVEGRQPLGSRLHLLAQRSLEVRVAVESDLADEPKDRRARDSGAFGELRQALEPCRWVGREQRAGHPALGGRHLAEPLTNLLADRLAGMRRPPPSQDQDSYAFAM